MRILLPALLSVITLFGGNVTVDGGGVHVAPQVGDVTVDPDTSTLGGLVADLFDGLSFGG